MSSQGFGSRAPYELEPGLLIKDTTLLDCEDIVMPVPGQFAKQQQSRLGQLFNKSSRPRWFAHRYSVSFLSGIVCIPITFFARVAILNILPTVCNAIIVVLGASFPRKPSMQ